MKRFSIHLMGLAAVLLVASCGGKNNPLNAGLKVIEEQCGLGCPGDTVSGVMIKGIADGNAAISGVASIDAFFGSVVNFQSAADNVSAGIEGQLAAIRADFGMKVDADVAAELDAQIKTNLSGGLNIESQPAKCAVDATATVSAQARCEGKVMPPTAMVECTGGCTVEATADVKCDAGVDLECEFTAPTVDCQGTCEGTCQAKLDVAASCSGSCTGTCSGTCSAYSDAGGTQCAGTCSGMCKGTCEAKADASAKCNGTCNGGCKVTNPTGGCMGAAHADCRAKGSASVMCSGKCDGKVTPPSASAECDASAKAEANVNVQCTPPTLKVSYTLKAGVDAAVQAKFEAGLKALISVRLPALLQASARAKFVAQAGEDLAASAGDAVKTSIEATLKAPSKLSLKASFGLGCAAAQLKEVGNVVNTSRERLTTNLMAVTDISGKIGV